MILLLWMCICHLGIYPSETGRLPHPPGRTVSTDDQIARVLGISESTVRVVRSRIKGREK